MTTAFVIILIMGYIPAFCVLHNFRLEQDRSNKVLNTYESTLGEKEAERILWRRSYEEAWNGAKKYMPHEEAIKTQDKIREIQDNLRKAFKEHKDLRKRIS